MIVLLNSSENVERCRSVARRSKVLRPHMSFLEAVFNRLATLDFASKTTVHWSHHVPVLECPDHISQRVSIALGKDECVVQVRRIGNDTLSYSVPQLPDEVATLVESIFLSANGQSAISDGTQERA